MDEETTAIVPTNQEETTAIVPSDQGEETTAIVPSNQEETTAIVPSNQDEEVPTDSLVPTNQGTAIETIETMETEVPLIENASYPPNFPYQNNSTHYDPETQRVLDNATLAEASLQQSLREGRALLAGDGDKKRPVADAKATDRLSLRQAEEDMKEAARGKRGKR